MFGWRLVRDKSRTVVETPKITGVDLTGAFVVSDNHPLWRAVHQVLDDVEKETVLYARKVIGQSDKVISSVGAGEGISLVRQRLNELRTAALNKDPNELRG